MNFKKSLLVFCLVMCILFTVSSVAAGDVNDTAIASEDTIQDSADLALSVEKTPANDDISDGTLAVSEIDENESVAEIADDSAVSVSSDDNALSAAKYKVTFYKETGKYTNDKKVYFKVVNTATGKGLKTNEGMFVDIYYSDGEDGGFKYISTNSYGIGVYKFEDELFWDGDYIFKVSMPGYNSNTLKKKVTIYENNLKIVAKKLTVPKNSKKKFVIKVIGQNKKPTKDVILRFLVFTGKKYKMLTLYTDSKGIATFYGVSKLSEGTHMVKILLERESGYDNNNGLYAKTVTSYIIVGKASANKQTKQTSSKTKVTIQAKGLSTTYKSGKYFAAKVVKTSNGAPVKGLPVNVIIYTGNSYKAVTLKTTSKGNIAYSTKGLSVGTHKVVLKIKNNKRYAGKAVTTAIKITKKSSGSNSNTPSGGKLRTTITINEAYRGEYSGYNFKVTLKDSNGRKLANRQITIKTVMHVGSGSFTSTDTYTTNSNGVAEGYVSSMFGGITTYDATFIFSGDSGHYASSATRYIG